MRELTLLVDRIDPRAEVRDALVTLLPGERATFTVEGAGEASASGFADARTLRSLNDLVSP